MTGQGKRRWSVVLSSPLSAEQATARLRANVEPWIGALSKHVGSGGRTLHGDGAGSRPFEGELGEGGFSLQRIHYRGISHGPRQWCEGVIESDPPGCVVKIAYRLRAQTLVMLMFWLLVVLGLAAFGLHLGFGDRTPAFLAGVATILAIGAGFAIVGTRMERRICTEAIGSMLNASDPRSR